MNKDRTQLLWVWALRVWSKLQSGCLTIYIEGTRCKSSAAVFVNVTGLIKVQPKALFLTQDSDTRLCRKRGFRLHFDRTIDFHKNSSLLFGLWAAASGVSRYDRWNVSTFFSLSVHCLASAGHDVEDLIPQLKVRILELLLKMQPKLKVHTPIVFV